MTGDRDVISLAALLDQARIVQDWQSLEFTWVNKSGEKLVSEAQFKTRPSAADFEFVYFNRPESDDVEYSVMARRVVRQVRLGAGQPIALSMAMTLCPTLLSALCARLNDLEGALPES